MTTPVERTRSLRWGWEFLWELQAATNLSTAQQTAVQAILRHYPSTSDIDQWSAASVDVFAPMLAPEDHSASTTAVNPDVPVSLDRGPTSPHERYQALTDAFKFFRFDLMSTDSENLTEKQKHALKYVLRHFPEPGEIDHMALIELNTSNPTMSEQAIEKLKAENERLRTILSHLLPEKSGQYFICGGATALDSDGLPKTILVCPLFGAEGVAIYTQTSPYSAPGW